MGIDRERVDTSRMPRVFISYRRSDTGQAAAALHSTLADHLDPEVVFLDHDDLAWGQRWASGLDAALADRDVVLCLIGDGWEGVPSIDAKVARRIDQPGDIVRREISTALSSGIAVYPVLVDRAAVPRDLPPDIASMLERNATPLRSTDYELDLAVILVTLWGIRLDHGANVVLRVGERAISDEQFRAVIGKEFAPEVKLLTLAATGRMQLSMVDVRDRAPHLYVVLAEDADERDRRIVAALAAHWGDVTIAVAGVAAGYTITSLAAEPAWSWATEAVGPAANVVPVPAPSAGGGGVIETIRRGVAARPRVALLAGALAVGGVTGAAVLAVSGGGDDGDANLLAAFQRVHDSVAEDSAASPFARHSAREFDPCRSTFLVERLGAAEIELRTGITASSIDADLADGGSPLSSLDGVNRDPMTGSDDFEFRADAIAANTECVGGLAEAWKLDYASASNLLTDYGGFYAVEDVMAYTTCVYEVVRPTQDEMLATIYYWYYADGGVGGPLADGPRRYFELSTESNNRLRETRTAIAERCEQPELVSLDSG